jgi:hypothetical protein
MLHIADPWRIRAMSVNIKTDCMTAASICQVREEYDMKPTRSLGIKR